MKKRLPVRYTSEAALKKALKIKDFRHMTKDKLIQFASMIPCMDREVAISVINQFPSFAEFGKVITAEYMGMCDKLLASNRESQKAVINGYQTILDALSKRMDAETITEEERKSITEDMISVADKIAETDIRNKSFLDRMGTKIAVVAFGAVAIGGTILGAKINAGSRDVLPEIDDD